MNYLLILLIVFLIAIFIAIIFKIRLYESNKERLIIPGLIFFVAIICDSWLVYNNFLSFNLDKLLGIKIGVLPIEEYVFYLTVPYTILILYKFLKKVV